ncbi:MAG: exosortase-dependent surface protein XDP2 [Cyanobacteria bacterium P01_D01_bin.1]
MKLRQLAAATGLVVSGAIAFSAPAQAFSFTTNYTQALSGDLAPKGDIMLDSVTLENGRTINNFTLVDTANILSNDIYTGSNSGAASADIGDLATTGISLEALTDEAGKIVMNNLNLNNIIDTEDKGKFILDLQFEQAVDNVLLWERGKNSRMDVQALDASGNVIGEKLHLNSRDWDYAGFDINTREIGGAQRVGSMGISMADFGLTTQYISALRVSSEGSAYNGPDFKVLGSVAEVPEPSMLIGLGAAVAGLLASGRRKQEKALQDSAAA